MRYLRVKKNITNPELTELWDNKPVGGWAGSLVKD